MEYRILWLEDDVYEIGILTRPLEQDGHIVEKTQACIDAAARLGAEKYDAIILDIILEGDAWTRQNGTYNGNGYFGIDVLRYIRESSNNPTVPVVVFSCLSPDIVERELSQSGLEVAAILRKPASQKQLKEKILEAIAQGK